MLRDAVFVCMRAMAFVTFGEGFAGETDYSVLLEHFQQPHLKLISHERRGTAAANATIAIATATSHN